MRIRIARTINLHRRILNKVVSELSFIDGPMKFIKENPPLMFQENEFDWNVFFEKCSEYRQEHNFDENDFLIVLTELRNNANWFSFFSTNGERTIFVHASDWEQYVYSDSEFPIAYEVIANILQLLSFNKLGESFLKYAHKQPIGCVNDMCYWKPDITFKLRTGDICIDCLSVFSETVPKDIITQSITVFEYLRKKLLFNQAWHKPVSFDEKLPFSIAVTKRKMGTTLDPLRKTLMLIDHFDSIVRTAVLILAGISKTKHQMRDFLQERDLHRLPSLGKWVQALESLSNQVQQNFAILPIPDLSSRVNKVIQLAEDANIVYMRNEKRGHGYIDCEDSSYKNVFMELIDTVDNIEKLLSPLFYQFNYYHTICLQRIEHNIFTVRVYSLSGSDPTFIEKEITTSFERIEDLPIQERFYLVTSDSTRWIDLDPYFKYAKCNVCHHNRLLIYDGSYMLDPYVGHRFRSDM